jgi:hypothetical protein
MVRQRYEEHGVFTAPNKKLVEISFTRALPTANS